MTRTVLHHSLSALALVVLVFATTGSPVLAGDDEINFGKWSSSHPSAGEAPKGLTEKKHSQRSVVIDSDQSTIESLTIIDSQGANESGAPQGLATQKQDTPGRGISTPFNMQVGP